MERADKLVVLLVLNSLYDQWPQGGVEGGPCSNRKILLLSSRWEDGGIAGIVYLRRPIVGCTFV